MDPLYPIFSIFVVKSLVRLFPRVLEIGLAEECNGGKDKVHLTHLHIVDENNFEDININLILEVFKYTSGLKTNKENYTIDL